MEKFIDGILSLIESKKREIEEATEIVAKYSEKANTLLEEMNSLKNAVEIIKKEMKPNPIEPPVVKKITITEPVVSECNEEPKGQPFSSFLRDYKHRNKMTNDQLGELLNLTGQTIWKWCKGYSFPNNTILEDVYESLNAHSLIDKKEFLDSIEYSKAHRK